MNNERFKKILKKISQKKFVVILIILWALVSISMFLAYKNEWTLAMNRPKAAYQGGVLKEKENEQTIDFLENQEVRQFFTMPENVITGFSVFLNAEDDTMKGMLSVSLQQMDSDEEIESWEYNLEEMKSRGFFCFLFPEAIEVTEGEEYIIAITVTGIEEVAPKMVVSENGDAEDAVLEINGDLQNGIIPFQIFDGNHVALKYFFMALYIGMTILFGLVCLAYIKQMRLEWRAVGFVFCLGIIYMFVIPPFVSPDEGLHFLTVYEKSQNLMGNSVLNEEGKVVLPSDALWGGDKRQATADTYIQFMEGALGQSESVTEEVVTRAPITESLHPGYLPQIIGVLFAEFLSLNYEQILLVGRLFALLWYCLVIFWAVKLMPFGKVFLLIAAILPMTMQQVVSYNYDSVLIGICFLAIAYLLNLICTKRMVKWWDWLIMGGMAIAIASIKLVYLPVFCLALAIPREKFGGTKKKIIGGAWIAFICIGTLLVTRLATISSYTIAAGTTTSGTVEKMSISYCLDHLWLTIQMVYRTFEREFTHYLPEMLASPLGWLEVESPNILVLGFILVLLLSVVKRQDTGRRIQYGVQLNATFIALAVIALIMVATLNWTPISSGVIIGIQGRYFLPVLPLAVLMLENNVLVLRKSISNYLILSTIYLQCMSIYFFTLTAISK